MHLLAQHLQVVLDIVPDATGHYLRVAMNQHVAEVNYFT